MSRRGVGAWLGVALSLVLCAGLTHTTTAGSAAATPAKKKPNIVLILLDDLSTDLIATMPAVQRMQRHGASFTHSYVADSLCCTSRTTLLTGQFPHNTHVRTNTAGDDPLHPEGGWQAFRRYGNEPKSFNVALNHRRSHPYRTGFYGKYINQYAVQRERTPPPGWSDWHVIGGGGYREWNYRMTHTVRRNGERVIRTKHYGKDPRSYATSVLARKADKYIAKHRGKSRPYFLEVSTYATHSRNTKGAHPSDPRFPAAFRDRPGKRYKHGNCGSVHCKSLDVRDYPGFDDDATDNAPRYADGSPAPGWQPNHRVDGQVRARMNKHLRNRARMAQAADRMVARVLDEVGPDTYVFVTSDNGYHLGQHRLRRGKGTAYGHDIRVPLIVKGPGVKPGKRGQVVSNEDLAPTFEDIAGVRPGAVRDGRSFLPALRSRHAKGDTYAFVEHQRPTPNDPDDPDGDEGISAVPSYIAVRSRDAVLIRYDLDRDPDKRLYAYEFYRDLDRPGRFERTNQYDPSRPMVQTMTKRLEKFDGCRGATCRAASR